MNNKKIVDKTIRPLFVPTSLAPSVVTARAAGSLGSLPIGVYKGQAAFWDLDKAVNQPLVLSEPKHMLGILDGREEGYDLLTITIPLGTAVGAALSAQVLTTVVPVGEVWFINAIETTIENDATAGIVVNWRCSLFSDARAAVPNALGQAFLPAGIAQAPAGGPTNTFNEFGPWTTLVDVTNKTELLRVPAGASISLEATINTAAPTADMDVVLEIRGFVGKALVA